MNPRRDWRPPRGGSYRSAPGDTLGDVPPDTEERSMTMLDRAPILAAGAANGWTLRKNNSSLIRFTRPGRFVEAYISVAGLITEIWTENDSLLPAESATVITALEATP